MKKGNKRYYFVDENDQIRNIVLPPDTVVPDHYVNGMYLDDVTMERKNKRLSDVNRGIPKTSEHRTKMSLAKQNIPKSNDHKLNMSRTHKLRWQRVKRIQETMNISYYLSVRMDSIWRQNLNDDVPNWYKLLLEEQESCQ